MKIIILFLGFLFSVISPSYSQDQLRVVGEGKLASGELIDNANKDVNGQVAAGVKIKTDLNGLSFDANNGIIKTHAKSGEYLLFVSSSERVITIRKSGFVPLKIFLQEVGVRLKSGQVWELTITGDKQLDVIPVNFIVKPEDAVLFINGKNQNPPYRSIQLKEGKHTIKVSKNGFKTQEKTIEVTKNKNLFEIDLEEIVLDLQTVTFKSEPIGAMYYIDGIAKKQTNNQEFLYPGKYVVKWILSGYLDVSQTIEVKANAKNEFSTQFEKNTGTLTWNLSPSNASIFINKDTYANRTQAELAPGRYLIELSAEGYDPQSETIELKRGETLRKSWTLGQQTGKLQLMIEPIEAKVTLKQGAQSIKTWNGSTILKALAVGSYQLSAELNGYETQTKTITIQKDKTQAVEIKLEKSKANVGGKTIKNTIGMEFVLIPAGSFQMGSNESSDEKPIHEVTLSQAFYMGKYEVTQKEWNAVMGTNPSNFEGDNLPVEKVSWNDVQEFIKKLNQKEGGNKYRLPTEAEWEYAARAGSTTKWHFGDNESQLTDYAWYNSNSNSKTHDVGQKKPNQFGLYDMHGNVWEWVQDWYDSNYYQNSPKADPKGPNSGSRRVGRGGSWDDYAVLTRSANRRYYGPGYRYGNIGFRLLRFQ